MMVSNSIKRVFILVPVLSMLILYMLLGTKRALKFRNVQFIGLSNDTNQSNKEGYRINTRGCKISDLPLYDEETRPLFEAEDRNQTIWECEKSAVHLTRFNETSISIDWGDRSPLCYYRQFKKGSWDDSIDYGKFIGPVNSSILDLPEYEFVHLLCYDNRTVDLDQKLVTNYNKSDGDIVHDQLVPLVPLINKTSDHSVHNVLLLAIDSTSFLNFKRHFIRTEKFLKTKNFYELMGYNKVGANTFPNMIPFLTGHHSHEIVPDNELKNTNFDDWPLIWKKFAEKGFLTAFDEEMPNYGLFTYAGESFSKGFRNKPVDYYNRPYHYGIHWSLTNDFCYKHKAEFEHSLDWTLDMMRAMNKRSQKFFAYISICQLTHDWLYGGHYMDEPYFKFFEKVFAEGLNKNTMILFFSDHGLRYGKLRETHSGEIENRLPFMKIYLPKTIDGFYRSNLKKNQHRLTTPFDIHATLTHLIDGQPNHTLPHGLSLFDSVISEDRNCENASIPSMYCSCYEDIPVTDLRALDPENTFNKIVDKINSFSEKFRSVCAEYQLESVNAVYNRSESRSDSETKLGDALFYNVQLYLSPGHALFETLVRGYDKNSRFELISDITRISLYGNQSHCLHCDDCNEKFHKNYCFCRDLL